jgi:hypothetical protein
MLNMGQGLSNHMKVANIHRSLGRSHAAYADQPSHCCSRPRHAGKTASDRTHQADDVSRLLRYAEELDAQAVDLDRRAKEGG